MHFLSVSMQLKTCSVTSEKARSSLFKRLPTGSVSSLWMSSENACKRFRKRLDLTSMVSFIFSRKKFPKVRFKILTSLRPNNFWRGRLLQTHNWLDSAPAGAGVFEPQRAHQSTSSNWTRWHLFFHATWSVCNSTQLIKSPTNSVEWGRVRRWSQEDRTCSYWNL